MEALGDANGVLIVVWQSQFLASAARCAQAEHSPDDASFDWHMDNCTNRIRQAVDGGKGFEQVV